MFVTIQEINKNLPAVEALLMKPHHTSFVNELAPDDIAIEIICNGIIVNDDRISIEFSDGDIADYEIHTDDYRYIKIL